MMNRRALMTAAAALTGGLMSPGFSLAAEPKLDLKQVLTSEKVPALAVAVVTAKGPPVISVQGLRRADGRLKVAPEDAWLIADNTMGVTSAIYARLVQAGRLHWDTPLAELFPKLTLDAGWKSQTAKALFAHRTGVDDRVWITPEWLNARHADTRPARVQRADLAAQILAEPPSLASGPFLLARANYILAGAAMEAVCDQDFVDLAHDEAFDWWGAAEAGFGAPLGENPSGHRLGPDGAYVAVPAGELADYPAVMQPATGAHLSLASYGRFIQLILTNGGGWLSPDQLSRLARPYDSATSTYALGWRLKPELGWAKGPVIGHEGSNGLWRHSVVIAPERDLAVIVACNADNEVACQKALQLALKAYNPEQPPSFNELNLG